MDRRYIETNQVVEKYLNGLLSPDEQVEFEVFVLDKPDLLERLELDIILTDTLRAGSASNQATIGAPRFTGTNRWLPMAASIASVALGASLIANVFQAKNINTIAKELEISRSPQANIPILNLAPLRDGSVGFEPAGILIVEAKARTAILNIQLSFPEEPTYKVRILTHPQRAQVVEFDAVEPKGAGDLALALPKELLLSGDYYAEVSGAETKPVLIPFRLIAEK